MKKKEFLVNKRTILITGATGYLGKKLVLELKKQNRLILLDKKIEKKFKNLKNLDSYEVDFLDEKNLLNQIKKIKAKYKKIDNIVNLAAITGDQIKLIKKKNDIWKSIYSVNLYSLMIIFSEIKNNLLRSNSASILNISSIYGVIPPKFEIYKGTKIKSSFDYSSSKSSLIYLTKWLAKKYSPKIRVNCISPGGIYRNHSKKFVRNYSSKTPLRRMAREQDIVGPILFFLSDNSKYITGQNLIVDGGFSL